MSYYNTAALAGGWNTGDLQVGNAGNAQAWRQQAMATVGRVPGLLEELTGHITDTYPNIPAADVPDLITLAYMYDSSILNNDAPARAYVRTTLNGLPYSAQAKKAFKYIRNRVHRGDTHRRPMTRVQRINKILRSRANRTAKLNYLRAAEWYGSDPFQRRSRIGSYKNMITPPPRQRQRPLTNWEQRFMRELGAAAARGMPQPTWDYVYEAPEEAPEEAAAAAAVPGRRVIGRVGRNPVYEEDIDEPDLD